MSSSEQKKKECQINNTEHDNVTVPPNNQYIHMKRWTRLHDRTMAMITVTYSRRQTHTVV